MTTGHAFDATGLSLVRKGLPVYKDVMSHGKPQRITGIVTKANGERCWVQWGKARGSSYEWCKNVTVSGRFPEGEE